MVWRIRFSSQVDFIFNQKLLFHIAINVLINVIKMGGLWHVAGKICFLLSKGVVLEDKIINNISY